MDVPAADIDRLLDGIGLERKRRSDGGWVVIAPSVKRGTIAVGLSAGERTLSLQTFFMRAPDRNHEAVYRRLLRKNLAMQTWRFALDDLGDIYLLAEAPLAGLTADALDGLLGALATYVDEAYDGVMRTGFDVTRGAA